MRIPSRLLAGLTAVAAATTLGLTGGAAHAETQVRDDPAGDTVAPSITRVSPQSSADIVRLTGNHGADRLKFTFDLVDLTPGELVNVSARFLSPGGRDHYLTLTRNTQGKIISLVRNDGDRGELPCAGAAGSVLNAKDRVIVSVPRTCIGNPRSVRFGGGVFATTQFTARGIIPTSAVDDARRDGSVGQEIRLGTRELDRG